MSPTVTDLTPAAERVVASYLSVKEGETVIVLTDPVTPPELRDAIATQVAACGGLPLVVAMPARDRSGQEPPAPVAAGLQAADVVISICGTSMYHTEAKGAAQRAGVRGVFNAPIDIEAWTVGAMAADFVAIREVAERLAGRLRGASRLHVSSPAGTDVTMSIEGREPKGWLTGICRNPGEVSAYPGGEVSLPPVEGTTNGTIVIEHVMTDLGALSAPMVWSVRDGEVVDITGERDASRLLEHIDGVENARNIAEIGIGLNPSARLTDSITESKKKLGTAHMALGDSAGEYGGLVISDVHLDGMILDCSVEVDGEIVVSDGKVLV